MKPDRLENLLAAYAAQPPPTASAPSTAEVWREIERRRPQSVWSRMFQVLDWRELFSEPRMAAVAVAFAVVAGVVPAVVLNRAENERRLARQSIHFEVFAAESGVLGSVFTPPVPMVSNGRR